MGEFANLAMVRALLIVSSVQRNHGSQTACIISSCCTCQFWLLVQLFLRGLKIDFVSILVWCQLHQWRIMRYTGLPHPGQAIVSMNTTNLMIDVDRHLAIVC